MKHEHDDLEFLRQVWRTLDSPSPFRELEEEDEPTRAAVEWMQVAYRSAVPPACEAPPAQRSSPLVLVSAFTIAASLFALTLFLIWTAPAAAPVELAHVPPAKTSTPVPTFDPVEGRIEIQSGPVRLVFLGERN